MNYEKDSNDNLKLVTDNSEKTDIDNRYSDNLNDWIFDEDK